MTDPRKEEGINSVETAAPQSLRLIAVELLAGGDWRGGVDAYDRRLAMYRQCVDARRTQAEGGGPQA